RLAEEQRPAASLLAGLAIMAERPPLLAIAGGNNADELVKVRILLDATLPVIRTRTARLSIQLSEGRRLEQAAAWARAELLQGRQDLVARRQRFAAVEQRALQMANASGGRALSVGDIALAAGENVEQLRSVQANSRGVNAIAAQLALAEPAPPRPTGPEGPILRPPFPYELPAAAPVTEGLAE